MVASIELGGTLGSAPLFTLTSQLTVEHSIKTLGKPITASPSQLLASVDTVKFEGHVMTGPLSSTTLIIWIQEI